MSDLMAFVNARLDEDEAAAKAAAHWQGKRWDVTDGGQGRDRDGVLWDEDRANVIGFLDGNIDCARHAARHDPARVLREVSAKRKILDHHRPERHEGIAVCGSCLGAVVRWPCPTLYHMAAVWSGHPDYESAWAEG